MKNPFLRNIFWLSLVLIITGVLILFSCECKCCNCITHFSSNTLNVIIGLFSSALLLLLLETISYYTDKSIYDFLEGEYKRTIITDVIENSHLSKGVIREENLTDDQRKEFEKIGQRPIKGSKYVELIGYREIGKDWRIKLTYLHHGIYEGVAEYNNSWDKDKYGQSTEVKFTLTLNPSNITTGAGNYKYVECEDYGLYSFQVNESDKNEIVVTYQNTIPSGLAAGYEKWKRVK